MTYLDPGVLSGKALARFDGTSSARGGEAGARAQDQC